MAYQIDFTNRFKKDLKRCSQRGLDITLIYDAIKILSTTGTLPIKFKPHKLKGKKGNDTWECHIEPDWLMVWEQVDIELHLLFLLTGTHSDLF